MNELALTERLRGLRVPPPRTGFEERLQQALAGEARALREARSSRVERAPIHSARRIRRWGSRLSLGVALGLGASAAAAAAGSVWVLVRNAEPVAPAASTPAPALERAPSRMQTRGSKAVLELPTPESLPNQEVPPAPALLPAPLEAPAVQSELGHAPRLAAPRSPAPRTSDTGERRSAAEQPRSSATQKPTALTPFELPEHRSRTDGAAAGGTRRPTVAQESAARATSERRALPKLPPQTERERGRPEHSKHEPGAWPPGRENARERSGRDNAERGLERAREVRGAK